MSNDFAQQAAEIIRQRAPEPPRVGLVLGSGLGGLADLVENAVTIPYAELPGFPESTVQEIGRAHV